jgi:hypothetical protein
MLTIENQLWRPSADDRIEQNPVDCFNFVAYRALANVPMPKRRLSVMRSRGAPQRSFMLAPAHFIRNSRRFSLGPVTGTPGPRGGRRRG